MRDHFFLSEEEFGWFLDVPRASVHKIELEKTRPDWAFFLGVAQAFAVGHRWLITGEKDGWEPVSGAEAPLWLAHLLRFCSERTPLELLSYMRSDAVDQDDELDEKVDKWRGRRLGLARRKLIAPSDRASFGLAAPGSPRSPLTTAYTRAELAGALGTTEEIVSRFERGEETIPRYVFWALERVCKVSHRWFLTGIVPFHAPSLSLLDLSFGSTDDGQRFMLNEAERAAADVLISFSDGGGAKLKKNVRSELLRAQRNLVVQRARDNAMGEEDLTLVPGLKSEDHLTHPAYCSWLEGRVEAGSTRLDFRPTHFIPYDDALAMSAYELACEHRQRGEFLVVRTPESADRRPESRAYRLSERSLQRVNDSIGMTRF